RVACLRGRDGVDPGTCLWVHETEAGTESVVADPKALGADDENLPPEERARRERLRESGGGIVSYSVDDAFTRAVFTLSGRLFYVDLVGDGGAPRELPAATPVVDPRISPAGDRVAYVSGGAVRNADTETRRAYSEIPSLAEAPELPEPRVEFWRAGERRIPTALVLPSWYREDLRPLPVLMAPYGGPHAQRVLNARGAYLTAQWYAEQGFAVLIADGRGTPGIGVEWEQSIHLDLAAPVLDDQVAALRDAAARFPFLDTARVGIHGWSFGGFLAALAVLRRPDVFHAAVAGAPVIDWELYDTHYTERYLGTPQERPEAYVRSSLLEEAAKLERPLMMIHGLADDNVAFAHTQRMSSALMAAGRPHTVLPLSGVTHSPSDPTVAENLMLLQVEFLKENLRGE
ncbi:S9 family peptidase, partial [Nocardiopsis tropica]|nr:S9 family peptidase [Nocardiopsis tropica]